MIRDINFPPAQKSPTGWHLSLGPTGRQRAARQMNRSNDRDLAK
ncbi:hypothetical protein [Cephaloticoccus primus]|nr:hypothetical protein [Cephaloticoccus primus]